MSGSVSMVDGHIDPDKSRITDKKIIKALECHIGKDKDRCKHCAYTNYGCDCLFKLLPDLFDLINRQQARIKELEERCNNK